MSFNSDKRLSINTPVLELGISFIANSLVPRVSPPLNLDITIEADAPNTLTIKDTSIIRYFLVITGSQDGLEDIELPLSSFQAVRRTGADTYLSVTVPTAEYADEISARQNGKIVIKQGYEYEGEIVQIEAIIETDIDTIDIYEGGRNQSILLRGYTYSSFSPKIITLSTSTYRASIEGKLHYRIAKPNIFLNPGDTVNIGADSFVIGTMTYIVSARNTTLELKEA